MYRKLIYRNFYGKFNVIICRTIFKIVKQDDCILLDRDLYDAHLVIIDNIIWKNHTGNEKYIVGNTISEVEIRDTFGTQIG